MSEAPDNLVLTMLRDIRATLDIHGDKLEAIRKEVREWQETSATAAGFSMHANMRHDGVDQRLNDLERRLEQLERRP